MPRSQRQECVLAPGLPMAFVVHEYLRESVALEQRPIHCAQIKRERESGSCPSRLLWGTAKESPSRAQVPYSAAPAEFRRDKRGS